MNLNIIEVNSEAAGIQNLIIHVKHNIYTMKNSFLLSSVSETLDKHYSIWIENKDTWGHFLTRFIYAAPLTILKFVRFVRILAIVSVRITIQ